MKSASGIEHKTPNQAMQLTATRFTIYAHCDFRYSACVQSALSVAAADLVSR
jgi:hypothetical protein